MWQARAFQLAVSQKATGALEWRVRVQSVRGGFSIGSAPMGSDARVSRASTAGTLFLAEIESRRSAAGPECQAIDRRSPTHCGRSTLRKADTRPI
jgi:hypothetical protein